MYKQHTRLLKFLLLQPWNLSQGLLVICNIAFNALMFYLVALVILKPY